MRVVPPWFGAWCERRDGAPRVATETARLAVGLSDGDAGVPRVTTHVPWLFVDDLEAHYAHAVSRGAVIVQGIHRHGYRGYVARDPDGYTWTIAQARPGMPA